MDDTEGTAAQTSPLFAMSGDGVDDVQIPMVFLFNEESKILMKIVQCCFSGGVWEVSMETCQNAPLPKS